MKDIVAIGTLRYSALQRDIIHNALFAQFSHQPLLHYMPVTYFCLLVSNRQLHLRRLDQFRDDSEEGRYPPGNLASMSADLTDLNSRLTVVHPELKGKRIVLDDDPQSLMASQDIDRRHSYCHCWFGGCEESVEMWKAHGDKGRGVCMRSSTTHLQKCLLRREQDLCISIGKVTYTDDDMPLPTLVHSAIPCFRKRTRYQGEKEHRVLARVHLDAIPATPETTRLVAIDPSVLIQHVIIGPNVDGEQEIDLRGLIAGHLKGATVGHSQSRMI